MDKNTLSNYGWIVIAVLVLAVMIALATPFGKYIESGVRSTTAGLFDTSEKAMNVVGMSAGEGNFEDGYTGGTPDEPVIVGSATFSAQTGNNCDGSNDEDGLCFYDIHDCWVPIEPVTLTWDELKLTENGTRYGYDASKINDTSIGDSAFPHSSLTSITIPDGVTSIGEWAFYECYGLTSITIPDSVTSIGDYAFYWCENITSITIPDSVISIGDYAFHDCASLTSITIPDSVTSIGDYAFNYCTNLTSITLGNSVTSIAELAFNGCLSLTSVTIGNSVTSIDERAFHDCSSLTSITIPNSVTSIGDYAFYDCDSLTSITIGDGVTSIGEEVFYSCDSLTNIKFNGTVAEWNSVFEAPLLYDRICTVTCTNGTVETPIY